MATSDIATVCHVLPRVRTVLIALVCLVDCGGTHYSGAKDNPSLYITAARMLDVANGTMVANPVVMVRNDRIIGVGTHETISIPDDAQRLDMGDKTLLPGLIDTHVHLTLGGVASVNARATLEAGFTTVQDLGALGYSNLALRNSIAAGQVVGPTVISAGLWQGISGGVCEFDGNGAASPAALLEREKTDVARGADVIKICVTGWPADAYAEPERVELSPASVVALVAQGQKMRRPVVAHAIGRAGAAAAVQAGVRGLAHAAFVDDETIHAMRKKGIWLSSTLASLAREPPAVVEALWVRMQAALGSRVRIVLGTDAGVIPHGSNAREFAYLVQLGMTPLDAICAGTSRAANALGLDDRGSILPGKRADLIAVDGDPIRDISVLERVAMVMKGGIVVFRTE